MVYACSVLTQMTCLEMSQLPDATDYSFALLLKAIFLFVWSRCNESLKII